MSNASIDGNSRQTVTALLNTDGKTITRIKATNNSLDISVGTTGSNNGGTNAATDDNDRPTMFASDTGNDLIALYADSSGSLLVQST